MSLTPDQRAAAHAPGSVVVTAGAGTGKTHMLAERYLFHVADQGLTPLQIVAVTFTEKAAAEMRERIRDTVAERLPGGDHLAELEAAPISTLHALAARICREHPEAAGVCPDFEILDEHDGQLWLLDQLEGILDGLPSALYDQVPYSLLRAFLEISLADPHTARRALECGSAGWPKLIEVARQEALNDLLAAPGWADACTTLRRSSGKDTDKLEAMRQGAVGALATLEAAAAGAGEAAACLEAIAGLKINVGSKANWPDGDLDAVKAAIKCVREHVKDALDAGLVTLAWGPMDDQLVAMLPALRQAFESASDALLSAKLAERRLDFADLEVHALRALEDPEVRAYYAARWLAYIVDEFQDTNPIQAQLLEHLTAGAKLTLVGDVKQSIYGFRRADVTVFEQFRRRIQAEGGQEVVLGTSFRTHGALIEAINRVCRPVLGPLAQDLSASRQEAPHPGPHLTTCLIQSERGPQKPDRQRAEAQCIARRIGAMLAAETPVYDKALKACRPMRPGDVAVLARTWGPLSVYGEALAAAGITSVHAGGGNLFDTREALDAWALLRFLASPHDSLALAAVLRSPFFALSDRVLTQVAEGLQRGDSWWNRLKEQPVPGTERAVGVLGQLLHARRTESPSRLLQLADRLTGYTAVLANLPGAPRREADWRGLVDRVRALEAGGADVFSITRRLKRFQEAEIAVPRPPLEAGDAVALMTVHAAKGLEWPVVIVPDLGRSPIRASQLTYMDTELGLALKLTDELGEAATPALYTLLKTRQDRREDAEDRRVFYVALTRVRDQLLLTAADEKGGALDYALAGLEAAGIAVEAVSYEAQDAVPPILPAPVPQAPYARLLFTVNTSASAPPETTPPVESATDWEEVFLLVEETWHPLLTQLQAAGLPAPIPGYEHAAASGKVIATAELAWPAHGVAGLAPHEGEATFAGQGWHCWKLETMMSDTAELEALTAQLGTLAVAR
jgi:ATP-dependent helicase/nuclease subunit A